MGGSGARLTVRVCPCKIWQFVCVCCSHVVNSLTGGSGWRELFCLTVWTHAVQIFPSFPAQKGVNSSRTTHVGRIKWRDKFGMFVYKSVCSSYIRADVFPKSPPGVFMLSSSLCSGRLEETPCFENTHRRAACLFILHSFSLTHTFKATLWCVCMLRHNSCVVTDDQKYTSARYNSNKVVFLLKLWPWQQVIYNIATSTFSVWNLKILKDVYNGVYCETFCSLMTACSTFSSPIMKQWCADHYWNKIPIIPGLYALKSILR